MKIEVSEPRTDQKGPLTQKPRILRKHTLVSLLSYTRDLLLVTMSFYSSHL